MPLITVGRSVTISAESPDGGALPANFIGIAASDGSLLQALQVQAASSPNLRVGIWDGAIIVTILDDQVDGVATTRNSMVVAALAMEFDGASFDRVRSAFRQSVTGITSTGTGTVIDMTTTPMSKFTIQTRRTGGTLTYTVLLEGSIDNLEYFTIATITETAPNEGVAHSADTPFDYVRYNVTVYPADTDLEVKILATGR